MRRWGFAPFCAACPARHAVVASLARTLVPVNLTLQSSWFFHRPSPSHAFIRWVFGRVSGFACLHCASFKPFWPPALASQAPPAIILAALRRFRGPALFRGLRPSSSPGAPFWPSGLTLRSSGLAFSQPLTLAVSNIPCCHQKHLLNGSSPIDGQCSLRFWDFLSL